MRISISKKLQVLYRLNNNI